MAIQVVLSKLIPIDFKESYTFLILLCGQLILHLYDRLIIQLPVFTRWLEIEASDSLRGMFK